MEISTKKQLAVLLSRLKGFNDPKIRLEQYETEPDIAAEIVWNAFYRREIEGKMIADLGCGTGILGLSSLIMGAEKVFFVDIDEKSIDLARQNLAFLEEELNTSFEKMAVFVNKDIEEFDEKADVVMQNPPFGIKGERHKDREFLDKAFDTADIVYSFHKAESKGFVKAFSKDKGFEITSYWEFDWPLKRTQHYHKKRIQYIKVGCFRLEKAN